VLFDILMMQARKGFALHVEQDIFFINFVSD